MARFRVCCALWAVRRQPRWRALDYVANYPTARRSGITDSHVVNTRPRGGAVLRSRRALPGACGTRGRLLGPGRHTPSSTPWSGTRLHTHLASFSGPGLWSAPGWMRRGRGRCSALPVRSLPPPSGHRAGMGRNAQRHGSAVVRQRSSHSEVPWWAAVTTSLRGPVPDAGGVLSGLRPSGCLLCAVG